MTNEEKRRIRHNAWSLSPDQEPTGKFLFSEERKNEIYYYYESDVKGEYVYDTESYRAYRILQKDRKRRERASRRSVLA